MPLFEHMPYTNFENINLDWILKTIKQHDTDISTLKTDVQNINGQITTINTNITQIIEEIGEIDLSSIESRVSTLEGEYTTLHNSLNNVTLRLVADEGDIAANTGNIATNTEDISTNNDASIARDNALAARIASLERAHLHDIYNYYSEGNMLLFGSDLRNLPDSCKRDGFPIGYGNPTNRHLYVGQTKTRAWKLTANGFQPDTSSTDGYDYYQMGQFPASLGVADYVTVTFAVSTGGDATPSAWYKHTFQASNEQWEVASGCIVKFAQHTDGVNPEIYTVQFLGTPASWANVVDSTHYIPYIFVEWGTGSVSTEATDKCKFDIKDRLPFMDIETPEAVIPGGTYVATGTAVDVSVTYYDLVGEAHTINVPMTPVATINKWGNILAGVLEIKMNLTANVGDVLGTGGCFFDAEFNMEFDSPIGFHSTPTYVGQMYDVTSGRYFFPSIRNNNINADFSITLMRIGDGVSNERLFRVSINCSSSGLRLSSPTNSRTMVYIPIDAIVMDVS